MLPTKELFGLDALSLYGLRAKAIKEQISLQEIGRIFFHLNQKRGYRSSRKTGQNEKSDYLNNIKAFESELLYNQRTVGEYFFEQLSQNPHFQVKKKILYRHNYISEFEKIYATQVAFYPTILSVPGTRHRGQRGPFSGVQGRRRAPRARTASSIRANRRAPVYPGR
jgi:CRISPR-associated endonuclease Csn1